MKTKTLSTLTLAITLASSAFAATTIASYQGSISEVVARNYGCTVTFKGGPATIDNNDNFQSTAKETTCSCSPGAAQIMCQRILARGLLASGHYDNGSTNDHVNLISLATHGTLISLTQCDAQGCNGSSDNRSGSIHYTLSNTSHNN